MSTSCPRLSLIATCHVPPPPSQLAWFCRPGNTHQGVFYLTKQSHNCKLMIKQARIRHRTATAPKQHGAITSSLAVLWLQPTHPPLLPQDKGCARVSRITTATMHKGRDRSTHRSPVRYVGCRCTSQFQPARSTSSTITNIKRPRLLTQSPTATARPDHPLCSTDPEHRVS